MQTSAGPVLAASVSVSLYELCSIYLEALVLLVSSILSHSYTISVSFSYGFSKL